MAVNSSPTDILTIIFHDDDDHSTVVLSKTFTINTQNHSWLLAYCKYSGNMNQFYSKYLEDTWKIIEMI